MNLIDLLLIIIIFGCTWLGFQKGFLKGLVQVIVMSLALVAVLAMYSGIQSFIHDYFPSAAGWLFPLVIFVLFIICRVLIDLLVWQIFDNLEKNKRDKWNMLTGFIPGFFVGLIWAILIVFVFAGSEFESLRKQANDSSIAKSLLKPAGWFDITPYHGDKLKIEAN